MIGSLLVCVFAILYLPQLGNRLVLRDVHVGNVNLVYTTRIDCPVVSLDRPTSIALVRFLILVGLE
jgi:hypothetical protein